MTGGEARSLASRRQEWRTASSVLAALSDDELSALLRAGRVGQGIGGTHAVLDVQGVRVFAKSVPLTEEERRNPASTANLSGLPLVCHYGVGSPSANVWREVVAHETTTAWVLDGEQPGFPVLHHWRVLPGSSHEVAPEHADVEAAVAFFGGDRAVARRLEATAAATWSVVLFLEHVPWNVEDWLGRELDGDDAAAEAAVELLERTLPVVLAGMNERGLFHFDSHLRNILTDGAQVHVSDFGLATSVEFELTSAEREFVEAHRLHDPAYTISRVVNQVVTARSGVVDPLQPDVAARNAYIRACAEGGEAHGLSPGLAASVSRFAPLVVLLNDHYWQLFDGPPLPPFPTDAVAAAVDATGLLG